MDKYVDIKKEIDELIDVGKGLCLSLVKSRQNDNSSDYFLENYERWYSKALEVVKTFCNNRLEDFTILYRNDKRKELNVVTYTISDAIRGISQVGNAYSPATAARLVFRQLEIVRACRERLDSKIYNIQTILQADVFDSEIDSAKHLVKRGFLRAAGAICGVILEKHFASVCQNRNIVLRKKTSTIADYNDKLKDENVYDVVEWRRIQRLGDIRNLCDHNKDREPTKEEVEELISGTEKVIKTIF